MQLVHRPHADQLSLGGEVPPPVTHHAWSYGDPRRFDGVGSCDERCEMLAQRRSCQGDRTLDRYGARIYQDRARIDPLLDLLSFGTHEAHPPRRELVIKPAYGTLAGHDPLRRAGEGRHEPRRIGEPILQGAPRDLVLAMALHTARD